jgi:hypothetical protein
MSQSFIAKRWSTGIQPQCLQREGWDRTNPSGVHHRLQNLQRHHEQKHLPVDPHKMAHLSASRSRNQAHCGFGHASALPMSYHNARHWPDVGNFSAGAPCSLLTACVNCSLIQCQAINQPHPGRLPVVHNVRLPLHRIIISAQLSSK